MREVISLSTGQAGVQIGHTCWELYCWEHGLDKNGFLAEKFDEESPSTITLESVQTETDSKGNSNYCNQESRSDRSSFFMDGFDSFYMEMTKGNYAPRNLMIDLEPTVVDVVRNGPYRNLYAPNTLINSQEDAANNFARGYYSSGKRIMHKVLESIRQLAENCDRIQGFMGFHSIGGGTGSGFHSSLTKNICQMFPKKSKLEIAIFPSPTLSTAVVEPYNAILTTHSTIGRTDCIFLADNEAMYNICQKKLNIDSPSYSTLNRLLSQIVSSITTSLRFKGTLNADFSDFQTNLVPYPRIQFPVMSYAPITSTSMVSHEPLTVYDITSKCFDYTNRLVRCENENGRYISCCLLYRGDVTPKDVNSAIAMVKQKKDVRFVEWSPTGFKVGINSRAPASDPNGNMAGAAKACCMLCNTTAIKEAWANLNRKFHIMLSKRAFLHWYLREGMETKEFYDAQDDLLLLEQDYNCLSLE